MISKYPTIFSENNVCIIWLKLNFCLIYLTKISGWKYYLRDMFCAFCKYYDIWHGSLIWTLVLSYGACKKDIKRMSLKWLWKWLYNMALVWHWDSTGMTLGWHWDDTGMVLEWHCSVIPVPSQRHPMGWHWDDTEMTLEWDWNGSGMALEMTLKWPWNGSQKALEWPLMRSGMALKWPWNGSGMAMERLEMALEILEFICEDISKYSMLVFFCRKNDITFRLWWFTKI